ncbi:hypothetical protein PISMIDRAFT_686963 [Pisolithus microcarpus 441]|uniref:Mug135-like C-terminal domain-containing protein n=1 Tax=Pisolithus microcarpus 441 TaxID=765257 RepID=A0A0C9YPL2_9AGAM|nr:hypothetical protein BKA83DRAFT_686963 [Pisolithus microcarpus]KIK15764.1 hypothetical protein PISMIDRAFT_686963 [Pisolithus microcarpus 441]
MTQGRPQDANADTRKREFAAIQEIVTTAVATALEPVASSLGDLQEQLGPVTAHLQENTVDMHGRMVEDHLKPLQETLTKIQPEILGEMGQRSAQLDSSLESLQNQVDVENQHLKEFRQSAQATCDVAAVTCERVGHITDDQNVTNKHVTDLVVNSRQIYNSGCGSGFTRPFKAIPFIRRDGSIQPPSDLGLPPLLNTSVIDNLTDHQLNQYLEGYGIEHNGLNRERSLFKLREYIGCTPAERSDSHATALFFMLAMACLLYLYFPQLFA